jgi:hypothetical protein
VRLVWRVALGVLRPVLSWAKVDLFPDPSWGSSFDELSSQARAGWSVRHEKTESRKGIGAAVDLRQDQLFEAFRHYGIESIRAVASGDDFVPRAKGDPMVGDRGFAIVIRKDPEFPLVANYDQGYAVSFELTGDEYAAILAELATAGAPTQALTRTDP